jgi:hypothetical protein
MNDPAQAKSDELVLNPVVDATYRAFLTLFMAQHPDWRERFRVAMQLKELPAHDDWEKGHLFFCILDVIDGKTDAELQADDLHASASFRGESIGIRATSNGKHFDVIFASHRIREEPQQIQLIYDILEPDVAAMDICDFINTGELPVTHESPELAAGAKIARMAHRVVGKLMERTNLLEDGKWCENNMVYVNIVGDKEDGLKVLKKPLVVGLRMVYPNQADQKPTEVTAEWVAKTYKPQTVTLVPTEAGDFLMVTFYDLIEGATRPTQQLYYRPHEYMRAAEQIGDFLIDQKIPPDYQPYTNNWVAPVGDSLDEKYYPNQQIEQTHPADPLDTAGGFVLGSEITEMYAPEPADAEDGLVSGRVLDDGHEFRESDAETVYREYPEEPEMKSKMFSDPLLPVAQALQALLYLRFQRSGEWFKTKHLLAVTADSKGKPAEGWLEQGMNLFVAEETIPGQFDGGMQSVMIRESAKKPYFEVFYTGFSDGEKTTDVFTYPEESFLEAFEDIHAFFYAAQSPTASSGKLFRNRYQGEEERSIFDEGQLSESQLKDLPDSPT